MLMTLQRCRPGEGLLIPLLQREAQGRKRRSGYGYTARTVPGAAHGRRLPQRMILRTTIGRGHLPLSTGLGEEYAMYGLKQHGQRR